MEVLTRGPTPAPSIPYRAVSPCPRFTSVAIRGSLAASGALGATLAAPRCLDFAGIPFAWARYASYTRTRAAWTRLLRARADLTPLITECPSCGTLFYRRIHAHLCAPPSCTDPFHDHADGCPSCDTALCPACGAVYGLPGPCPGCEERATPARDTLTP